jgi:hypothetical protein
MSKEARTVGEYFTGPEDAPAPDRWAQGRIAELMADARQAGTTDLLVEVRTTDAGTTNSDKLFHVFVRATDPPENVAAQLQARIEQDLEDAWGGQLRLNVRDRQTSQHLGSFSRTLRPPPASTLATAAPTGGMSGILVLREPDAIRPWVDLTLRTLAAAQGLLTGGASMMQAAHPPTANNAPAALLQALTAVGSAASAPASSSAPASTAPSNGYQPGAYGAPSWPTEAPLPPAPVHGSVSMIEDQATNRALSEADVEAWAKANPDAARRMVMRAMSAGAS